MGWRVESKEKAPQTTSLIKQFTSDYKLLPIVVASSIKKATNFKQLASQKWNRHIAPKLTPKLLWPIFCSFLKFGQAILVRVLMINF